MTAFTFQNRTQSVQLGAYTAVATVTPIGQQDAWQGDALIVEALIALPANNHGAILRELRFEDRVKVAGYPLTSTWGSLDAHTPSRSHTRQFMAATWAEAFALASDWVRAELTPLQEATSARRAAYLSTAF